MKSSFGAALGIGLSIILIYGACLAFFIPRDGFWAADTGCKFIQMEGLIQSGYRVFDIRWPGAAVDPDLAWAPIPYPFGIKIGGKLFLQYTPIFALLASVPYRLIGFAGLYVLPCLAGLLLLPAVYGIARETGSRPGAAPLAVLLTGLAGPLWFYSLSFWEHTLAVALLGWSIWAGLCHLRTGTALPLVVAALLSGLAIYVRDELYLFAGIWAVVQGFLSPRRRIAWLFPAVAVVTLIPLWIFYYCSLGNPCGYHFVQAKEAFNLARFVSERVVVFRNLFLNAHPQPIVSLLLSIPLLSLGLFRSLDDRWAPGIFLLMGLSGLLILVTLAASTSPMDTMLYTNGLFAPAPILAVGFARFAPAKCASVMSGSRGLKALVWLTVGYAIGYGCLAPVVSSQGIHWGCRFLLPVYPLLAILAARVITALWRNSLAGKATITAAVGVAVLLQLFSIRLLIQRQTYTKNVASVLSVRPERVFVTNVPLLPTTSLAPLFFSRPIFLVRTPEELTTLLARLREAGVQDVAWLTHEPPHSVPAPGAIRIHDPWRRFLAVDVRTIRVASP